MTWLLGALYGLFVMAITAPVLCTGSSGGGTDCVSVTGLQFAAWLPGGTNMAWGVAMLLGAATTALVARLARRRGTRS